MLTAADLIQALSNLDHPSTAGTANTPSSGTPATAPQLPTPYQPSAGTLMTTAATPTPTGPANAMCSKGGSDLPQSGSIREGKLPLPLPTAPTPSPALPAAAHRRRRDGQPQQVAPARSREPVPYGSSPAVHPDTGEPLALAAKGGRNRALWASLPAGKAKRGHWGGDDTPSVARAKRIVAAVSAYAARCATIAA